MFCKLPVSLLTSFLQKKKAEHFVQSKARILKIACSNICKERTNPPRRLSRATASCKGRLYLCIQRVDPSPRGTPAITGLARQQGRLPICSSWPTTQRLCHGLHQPYGSCSVAFDGPLTPECGSHVHLAVRRKQTASIKPLAERIKFVCVKPC